MKKLFFLILLIISGYEVAAQGCSDAGFCTMGAMRPDQSYSTESLIKLRAVEINQYRGTTTLSPVIWVTTLDITVGINTRNFIQLKLPYQHITGNLTDLGNNEPVNGMGDISLSFTRNIIQENNYDINVTLGAKIPSNNAALESTEGVDHHMYYQTSLGTYDLVAGASFINKKWLFATGYQRPLIHRNKNDFRWGQWNEYPDPAYINNHDTHRAGTEFRRGSDVMVRVERNFRFSNYSFNIGVLPIFRITPDQAYDPLTDTSEKIENTTGMALSALAGASYHFDVNSSLRFIYGRKVTQREYNPDGLTRHAVYSFSYIYRF
ncbi:MAG: hypothetical protein ACNS60_03835 [Candidatus Cyclobacteriaceae bacterium M2_1C_046]